MVVAVIFLQNTGKDKLLLPEVLKHDQGHFPLACSLSCDGLLVAFFLLIEHVHVHRRLSEVSTSLQQWKIRQPAWGAEKSARCPSWRSLPGRAPSWGYPASSKPSQYPSHSPWWHIRPWCLCTIISTVFYWSPYNIFRQLELMDR